MYKSYLKYAQCLIWIRLNIRHTVLFNFVFVFSVWLVSIGMQFPFDLKLIVWLWLWLYFAHVCANGARARVHSYIQTILNYIYRTKEEPVNKYLQRRNAVGELDFCTPRNSFEWVFFASLIWTNKAKFFLNALQRMWSKELKHIEERKKATLDTTPILPQRSITLSDLFLSSLLSRKRSRVKNDTHERNEPKLHNKIKLKMYWQLKCYVNADHCGVSPLPLSLKWAQEGNHIMMIFFFFLVRSFINAMLLFNFLHMVFACVRGVDFECTGALNNLSTHNNNNNKKTI